MSNQVNHSKSSGTTLRWGLIALGVVACLALIFADKTNLNTLNGTELRNASATIETGAMDLPPLAPDPTLDEWRNALSSAQGSEKITLLDSLVNRLSLRGRYDFAADYAGQRAEVQGTPANTLSAGRLYQQASRLPHVTEDTTLFRAFADKSIFYLEKAVQADTSNIEAAYFLGLAYVDSRLPANSMKGILAIRKVAEENPDYPEASFSLGVFSIQTGQFEKAEKRFEHVLSLQPDNYEAMYYLAFARTQQNPAGEFRDLLNQVLANAKDAELKQRARNLLNNF